MTRSLLDRQVRLLEYLTSRAAIFGGRDGAAIDPSLQGINRALLNIEARFSHEKRMEKIAGIFPVTVELLGDNLEKIGRAFVDAYPPLGIGRVQNARQFHDFLCGHWTREPPVLRHLPDVAACELACALARIKASADLPAEAVPAESQRPAIRRSPGVVLLRTAFDIRAIFEGGSRSVPAERETWLAIADASGAPQILELPREVFDLLAALDQWTAFDEESGVDGFMAGLVTAGVLELRR